MPLSAYQHSPERAETAHGSQGQSLRDVVLGANDGLVSVMALVAGVAGATSGNAVLIAGVAGILAGAMSMGLGAFVAAKSYKAFYQHEEDRERWEMQNLPEVERKEIREIYEAKGFSGELLDRVVEHITSDPEVWLKVMMTEELGLDPDFGRPARAAITMFAAFVAGGIFPVFPFFFASGAAALVASIIVTAAGLMAAGVIRSRLTGERPVRAGLELIGMASLGVAAAFGVGKLVGRVV